VDGRDLRTLGEQGLTRLRRLRLGFVFQFFNLLPTLTAFENVFLSLELVESRDRRSASKALAAVGLEGKGHRYPHELSGGEQQRVAIARALVKKPAIILADEPTGNLDTKTGNEIMTLFDHLHARGNTIVLVTHEPDIAQFAHRVVHIRDGQIFSDEPSARVR
jgi:putative ABC transport system ATP-binding protein